MVVMEHQKSDFIDLFFFLDRILAPGPNFLFYSWQWVFQRFLYEMFLHTRTLGCHWEKCSITTRQGTTQSSSLRQISQHLSAPNLSKFTINEVNYCSFLGLLLLFFIFLLLFQEWRSSQALLLLLFLGTECRIRICGSACIPLALRESSVSVCLLLVVCVFTW